MVRTYQLQVTREYQRLKQQHTYLKQYRIAFVSKFVSCATLQNCIQTTIRSHSNTPFSE